MFAADSFPFNLVYGVINDFIIPFKHSKHLPLALLKDVTCLLGMSGYEGFMELVIPWIPHIRIIKVQLQWQCLQICEQRSQYTALNIKLNTTRFFL